MTQSKRRNQIVLVNRDFQLRYTKAAIGVGFLSTLLTAIVILYPLYQFEILRIPQFLPMPILLAMVVAIILNIFFVGFMGVFITHRIAGPMYALVRQMRRIEQGRYQAHLKIRDEDEMKYVVRNFNELVDALILQTKSDLKDLEAVEQDLGQDAPSRAKLQDIVKRYRDRVLHHPETPT